MGQPNRRKGKKKDLTPILPWGYSYQEAIVKTSDLISTGSTLPVATPLDSTDQLLKFVPRGGRVSAGTAFWTTPEQAAYYVENPSQIAGAFGLPLQSNPETIGVNGYDFYAIRPINGGVVYESQVAPTVQGTWLQNGEAIQRLVIDRNQFTLPVKVGSVDIPSE